jgi:hypothetical protein
MRILFTLSFLAASCFGQQLTINCYGKIPGIQLTNFFLVTPGLEREFDASEIRCASSFSSSEFSDWSQLKNDLDVIEATGQKSLTAREVVFLIYQHWQ